MAKFYIASTPLLKYCFPKIELKKYDQTFRILDFRLLGPFQNEPMS